MILLVAVEEFEDDDLPGPTRRVETRSEAASVLHDDPPAAMVLDRTRLGADADALVRTVRSPDSPDPTVPVVLLADQVPDDLPLLAIDVVLRHPVDHDSIAEAVDRALLVDEYKDAVHDFFRHSQDRATTAAGPLEEDALLRDLRDAADDRLDDLVDLDDPDLISALLWRPAPDLEE
ncbi:hypothetical protein ACFQH6_04465 [Halobacteriaceae archaeon GCM10025711]